MSDDATSHHKFEGRDNSQRIRYITWPEQNADDDQRPVLQPVNGNERRQLKRRAETHHGVKERWTNLATLRIIAQQGAQKLQLEE